MQRETPYLARCGEGEARTGIGASGALPGNSKSLGYGNSGTISGGGSLGTPLGGGAGEGEGEGEGAPRDDGAATARFRMRNSAAVDGRATRMSQRGVGEAFLPGNTNSLGPSLLWMTGSSFPAFPAWPAWNSGLNGPAYGRGS